MRIIIEKNVMVPMRDGVKLATDVYRPDSDKAVPTNLRSASALQQGTPLDAKLHR
ncbi:MAG: hypothetical protein NVSMB27_44210 [Ktedonobacteraceae bacterium]